MRIIKKRKILYNIVQLKWMIQIMEKVKKSNKLFPVIFVIMLLSITDISYAQTSKSNDASEISRIVDEIIKIVQSTDPTFKPFKQPEELDPSAFTDLGFDQVYKNDTQTFLMRDGKKLFAYIYPKEGNTTIVLLHGVLSNAYMMNKTSGLLREATNSKVIALDFRGHGRSEGNPGDIDYINQYSYDLADVVTSIKKENPVGEIIIAGHSMGGGIALRYAMLKNVPNVDGYLLLAPHLGHNSPTVLEPSNNISESAEEQFVKVHIARISGLKMLNSIGETQYNKLPVLFFNLPEGMPIRNYSYRANESMAPNDFKEGLQAVNKPLLVLVGSKDEAFNSSKFEEAVTENSCGEVFIIEDASHNGIRHKNKTMLLISKWVNNHKLISKGN